MKPDDRNGLLPPEARPFRVLLVAASERRRLNCAASDSKARSFMKRMAARLEKAHADWEVDTEDLGNDGERPRIMSCNACVSTAMPLCVWPCNCYEKGSKAAPDLMWDADLYARLDLADAWAFVGPVNWYAPTSNLKLMFDRLVCASGGNPREDLIDHKNPELAAALEHAPEWRELSLNHLEGRTAAFFCYSDGGANEEGADGRPARLRHKKYYEPRDVIEGRDAYAPLVWQCRYSGVEVPDALWRHAEIGKGRAYSDDQAEQLAADDGALATFDAWVDAFAAFVETKGTVPPGRYRAFGYEPPGHTLADLRLKLRSWRANPGVSPPDPL